MKALKYRITALAPLIFSAKTGDPNIVSTLDYIPGSNIRGLFANEYIKKNAKNSDFIPEYDPKFERWFLSGDIKFLNAYISESFHGKTYNFLPIPLSIQYIKGEENKATDIFIDKKEKDEETKPILNRYGIINEKTVETKSVRKSINFHHQRDRIRGVSKEGLIFNYESIDPDQIFEGYIVGDEENLKEFRDIFSNGIYYIGRSKTSQYGKVMFEFLTDEPIDFNFNEENIDSEYVVLYLTSNTIIYNEYGFPTVSLEAFERCTGIKVENCIIRTFDEEGFVSVWRLKTPSSICFRAGSSFKIKATEENIKRVKELWNTGIGENTHMGFGRFEIYSLNESDYLLVEFSKESKENPPEKLSKTAEEIIKSIVMNELINYVESRAINNAETFKNLPSKSLLSKLEKALREGNLIDTLQSLRKIARESLERCRNEKETLFDHLTKQHISKDDAINNIRKLRKFIDECKLDTAEIDKDKILQKKYMMTLLSTLRVRAKEGARRWELDFLYLRERLNWFHQQ